MSSTEEHPTEETIVQQLAEKLKVEEGGSDAAAGPAVEYKVSATASANVEDIMKADAEDESLKKYKESLLGAAAKGDLGDPNDPRKLIVVEFKVVFEEAGVPEVVYNLDTPAGIEELKSKGLIIKEGAKYKFKLKFRVQHQILTGIKFVNKTKRSIVSTTEEVVLGSYAPQTAPHEFEFPRHGLLEAPSGMMMRGKYVAEDRFIDSDGVTHLEYTYPVLIGKTWQG